MAAIGKVSDDIKKKALASDNTKVKNQADLALAALEQKKAAIMAQATDTVVTTTGRPMVASREEMRKDQELMTPYGRAPSVQAANVVREQAQQIDEARTGLSAASEYITKHGSFALLPGAQKGEYQAALVPVKRAYQVLLNLGVLNPSEDEKMDKLIKNKLSPDEAVSFINGLNKMVETKESALAKSYIVGGAERSSAAARAKTQLGFQ
jgi:L-lactate utilization protein LutC